MLGSLILLIGSVWAADDHAIDVRVKGMVCSFCIQGVEKKFSSVESIDKFKVDLDKSSVFIWLKKEQSLKDEQIRTLILDAGYEVEKITRPEAKPE